jgi:hypothetical protein
LRTARDNNPLAAETENENDIVREDFLSRQAIFKILLRLKR